MKKVPAKRKINQNNPGYNALLQFPHKIFMRGSYGHSSNRGI